MILDRLGTRNFRNLRDSGWSFHHSVNLVVGDNGQGKTNLLEAIYLLGSTRSFRTARLANVARIGSSQLYVEGEVLHDGVRRTLSIGQSVGDERRRELLVNGQKSTVHDFLRVLHLNVYSSAQLEIIRGGPEWRRRFIDRAIATIDGGHLLNLNRLTKVLRQRNALLDEVRTGRAKPSLLDPWDEELLAAAQPIVAMRSSFVGKLEHAYREIVGSHAYHVSDLAITYRPAHLVGEREADRATLKESRTKDLRVGFTTAGPHRDNLELMRHGLPAAEMLSSGEIKTTVLFLTMAAMEVYRQKYETRPIFLLDDIDAELDLGIVQRLLRYLVGTTQIFSTSAKQPLLEKLDFGPHRRFVLETGALKDATDVNS